MNEIIKSSLAFFYRKIVLRCKNDTVRKLILISRASSGGRHLDSAQTCLSSELLDRALAMNPEVIMVPTGVKPSACFEYLNEDLAKEEAINSVKSLISDLDNDPFSLLLFCDGSFFPNKGGAGAAYCPSKDTFASLSIGDNPALSNHESEAAGLLAALRMAKLHAVETNIQRVFIFVDNKGVIARTRYPAAPRPGQQLFGWVLDEALELSSRAKITLVWCPGHRDISGNEEADRLAKEAVEDEESPCLSIGGNFKKILSLVAKGLKPKRPTASPLPRAHSSLLNQLSSGHCTLNHFLFRIHRQTDPLCPRCGYKDTVSHLLNFCEAHRSSRIVLRRELRRLKIPFKSDQLHSSLKNPKAAEPLIHFLKSTSRFLAALGS